MERSSCVTRAVVAVTSVQPTSEKRTVWQLKGSRAAVAAAADAVAVVEVAAAGVPMVSFAAAACAKAAASAQPASTAAAPDAALAANPARVLRGLTGRPPGGHDCHIDARLEWVFNEFLLALTILP